jgi:hypothetical protein
MMFGREKYEYREVFCGLFGKCLLEQPIGEGYLEKKKNVMT